MAPALVAGLWLAAAPAGAQTRTLTVAIPNYNGPVVTSPPFPSLSMMKA